MYMYKEKDCEICEKKKTRKKRKNEIVIQLTEM